MEKNNIRKILYSTPCWKVLGYLLQHPDITVRGLNLVKALPRISKSAIYEALRLLEKIDVLIKEKDGSGYRVNLDLSNAWLHHLMIADTLVWLKPLVNGLSGYSSKIILFGSRAKGNYTSDSDYDVFIVSRHHADIRRIAKQNSLSKQIQLLIKTPEEWIDLHNTDPALYQTLQEGIVLWERK